MASSATPDELRRAAQRAKAAVRRAVLQEDFTALDRIAFEGFVAANLAAGIFERLIDEEYHVPGGPAAHPLLNRWRVLCALLGQGDPLRPAAGSST